MLQTFSQQLQNAISIEDVLLAIIKDYFSFFNYHVIEHIVDKLGTDQNKDDLHNYKKDFDEYSKRRVYECPTVYEPTSSTDHADLVLKLDSMYEKFTVKELRKFEYRLSRTFFVTPQSVLHLRGVCCSSSRYPHLSRRRYFHCPVSKRDLAADGVIRLTCGDYQFAAKVCIYLV